MRPFSHRLNRWLLLAAFVLCAASPLLATGAALAAQQMEQDPGGIAGGRMVRGTVTATAGNHLTVKTETGEVFDVVISETTRAMKNRAPVKAADIHIGDGIGAMGPVEAPGKTLHAAFLMVLDAEQVRKAREGLGKVFIAGRVTKIDETRLTVLRPDQVSQVIQVDEGTSFRRVGRGQGRRGMADGGAAAVAPPVPSGESITLPDIKVGDMVSGPGAIKEGLFTPTQLAVADGSRPRRAPGYAAPAPVQTPVPSSVPQ